MQSLSGYWFQQQLKTCLSYPVADTLAGWVYDAKWTAILRDTTTLVYGLSNDLEALNTSYQILLYFT